MKLPNYTIPPNRFESSVRPEGQGAGIYSARPVYYRPDNRIGGLEGMGFGAYMFSIDDGKSGSGCGRNTNTFIIFGSTEGDGGPLPPPLKSNFLRLLIKDRQGLST